MRFKYRNLTQTQIGQLFGVTSHVVGDWLAKLGLRDKTTKKPTREAHRGGYCETVAALREAGYALIDQLPEELVHPPELTGPFTATKKSVLNGSGEVALRAASNQHAEVVTKLLNAAHRHGTLDRLLGNPPVVAEASA